MKKNKALQLRFKTKAEFLSEYGEFWRDEGRSGWVTSMDYLFGLPCKPEWVGDSQAMHLDKCPWGESPFWRIESWMVTKAPLPAPIPFHKQYPVGSKIKIQLEVEVLEHDEVFTVKVAPKEGYMLQGGAQVWLKTSVITVIEDQP
jgi:hypothetical protein